MRGTLGFLRQLLWIRLTHSGNQTVLEEYVEGSLAEATAAAEESGLNLEEYAWQIPQLEASRNAHVVSSTMKPKGTLPRLAMIVREMYMLCQRLRHHHNLQHQWYAAHSKQWHRHHHQAPQPVDSVVQ